MPKVKRHCVLCRGDHSNDVVRRLCDVGFYATAMDYRTRADLATTIARLRRDSPHRLNGAACRALATELESESPDA